MGQLPLFAFKHPKIRGIGLAPERGAPCITIGCLPAGVKSNREHDQSDCSQYGHYLYQKHGGINAAPQLHDEYDKQRNGAAGQRRNHAARFQASRGFSHTDLRVPPFDRDE
jgi:hypothetical protein